MARTGTAGTVLLLLAAAAAAAGEEPASPPAPPKRETAESAAVAALADATLPEVEKSRGVRFLRPVERTTRSREEAKSFFKEEAPGEAAAKASAGTLLLRFLGLLEDREGGEGAEEVESRFLGDRVGGVYDPSVKKFFIVEGQGGHLTREIVFHELIHALDDQHYDLRALERALLAKGLSDHHRALIALIEGCAQYHTDRWVDAQPELRSKILRDLIEEGKPAAKADDPAEETRPGKPAAAAARDFPPFLTLREYMFPYHNGSLFVEHALRALPPPAAGEDPMARLFRDPPASTEQVLHPEKYAGGPLDLPREVTLPDVAGLLGEGWKEAGRETLGELGIGIAMNAFLYPKDLGTQIAAVLKERPGGYRKQEDMMSTPLVFRGTSGRASEGWDGDRLALLTDGTRSALAWVLVFDGPGDAREFAEGYAKVLKHKYRGAVRGEDGVWTGTREGTTAVVVEEDRVLVAERVPPAALSKVLDALRGAVVVRDPRDQVPALAK